MAPHPVRFRIERTAHLARIHILIRFVLLLAVGAAGCSSIYWIVYLTLPAFAALLISGEGFETYFARHAPAIVRVLRWLAAAYAYLWLLTDTFPTSQTATAVELEVATCGSPSPQSALLRVVYSLPALFLLAVLSLVAAFLWVVGALAILVWQRIPAAIADFFELTLRYQFRLIAYHLSLVDHDSSFEETLPARSIPERSAI